MNGLIVTGASSGIGRAVAELFLARGWRVGLIARSGDTLAEMEASHPGAVALPADVTDADAIDAAFETFSGGGRLDVLFNNAGIFGSQGTIDEIALETWRKVVDVNLTGMFIAARAAFRIMRHQEPMGGRIVNNGSISAQSPRAGSVCYTATKHAVTGLTKSLSLDGRDFDIACGQIDIGNARTDMVADLEKRRAAAGLDPQPVMEVADVANAVWNMATLPPEANVQFMTLMATKMPLIGRG